MSAEKLLRFGWILVLVALVHPSMVQADPVDDARLKAAVDDAKNWITFGHDYTNQRFSPSKAISPSSISQLAPSWIHQTGITGTFQTQPIVADGEMVITTPRNHMSALDAATGAVQWKYKHEKRRKKTRGGPSNRGAAMGYGKVFQATNDGRLIALDRATGKPVWDSLIATPGPGEVEALAEFGAEAQKAFAEGIDAFPAKMPPLVADGLVIVGVLSAGYYRYQDMTELLGSEARPEPAKRIGRRGYFVAFDAETGIEKWRWHTVKAPDKTGSWEGEFVGTTADGIPLNRDIEAEKKAAPAVEEAWRAGGGSAWMTPAYDPARGLLYVGTGNPAPADADMARPGDNLYTSSLVALDLKTGTVRWHYQIVPHDVWGYDVGSPPILFDVPGNEGPVAAVGVASKNGWFYTLDRTTGELLFKSEAFVPQENMFPRPKPGPNGEESSVTVIPGSFGGASWSPSAFDPNSGLVFVPGIHKPTRLTAKTLRDARKNETIAYNVIEMTDAPSWGTLTAIDTRKGGKIAWQVRTDQPLVGGLLATGGGIVFAGEGDGHFSAFDSKTGKRLWQFQCGAGVNAPPVAYEVNGVAHVAVAAGGHRIFGYPAGDAVISFALGTP